jgi:hypothetical protein
LIDPTQTFFDEIVEPAFREYQEAEDELTRAAAEDEPIRLAEARNRALRRARTAAIEMHQFADRVTADKPSWCPTTATATVQKVRDWLMSDYASPQHDVQVLHDAADAFKHGELTMSRKGRDWFVEDDRMIVSAKTGYGMLGWGEGKFSSAEEIIIEQKDGSPRSMLFVLTTVQHAWLRAMGRPEPDR